MDRFWIHAANYALEHKMPVLGICRGLQLVNVAFGGSLYQDLSYKNQDHMLHSQKQNRDYLIHQVTMDADSHLASILGAEPVLYQHHASPVRKRTWKRSEELPPIQLMEFPKQWNRWRTVYPGAVASGRASGQRTKNAWLI